MTCYTIDKDTGEKLAIEFKVPDAYITTKSGTVPTITYYHADGSSFVANASEVVFLTKPEPEAKENKKDESAAERVEQVDTQVKAVVEAEIKKHDKPDPRADEKADDKGKHKNNKSDGNKKN